MAELMTAKRWTVGEIARIAGVTSAAVSQWVGNGAGKQSKSIGNAEAALRLEKASGFSWIWLAQGKGPKLAATDKTKIEDVGQEAQLGRRFGRAYQSTTESRQKHSDCFRTFACFYGK
jgi:transcriptional regulator with XRE-family HTH domain